MSRPDQPEPDTSPFIACPGREEIDTRFAKSPWMLRARLTYEAYATRARNSGLEPTMAEWSQHLELTEDELQLIDDLIEARREAHALELGPRFIIREYGNKARVGWFNERGELVTMSFPEFSNAHAEKMVEVARDKDGRRKLAPLIPWWISHPLTRRFDTVEFRPGVEQAEMPARRLNLWRGWPMGLTPGWKDQRLTPTGSQSITDGPFDGPEMPLGYCDRFLEHMLTAMCGGDKEVLRYVLGWVADALWNPGPSETAIVLRGPEGSGKSLWAQHIMEFFGVHSITLDDQQQVIGNFNKHLMNKSIVFADEAFFAGQQNHASRLKTLVTRPDLFIEPKGVDGFTAPKMFRLIMASNEDHVIRAGREDRRYLVLTVDAREHNQDKEYFGALAQEWVSGGRQALFRWLTGAWWGQAVGGGQFRQWSRPVTAGLQEQKDLSLPPAQMLVHNILREGELPSLHLPDARRDAVFVATDPLKEAGRLRPNEHRALADALRVLAGDSAHSTRVYFGSGNDRRQYRGYWLPSLSECRQRWSVYLGREVDWPTDITGWAFGPDGDPHQDNPF